jgi:hypothetical protein
VGRQLFYQLLTQYGIRPRRGLARPALQDGHQL